VITRAGTDPRHGPGSQSRGSTGTRLAHRPRREPVNDLAAGPAAWTRITPQVCLKRSVMVHLDGAAVVRRRDLLTRRQRTRSLARTCQGSQHRPAACQRHANFGSGPLSVTGPTRSRKVGQIQFSRAVDTASAENTIARVHQVCPAGRRSSRPVGEPSTPTAEQADPAHPQRLPETENMICWAAASRSGDRPR
jgi:hypothetical protein